MPWWATLYLAILTVVIIISFFKNRIDRKSIFYQCAEIVSGIGCFLFIYCYWHTALIASVQWLTIPLLIYVISWDMYALTHIRKSNYPDLTEEENREMDRYSKVFAMLFILPCYIAGILLIHKLYS
ncbi:MAG: hypothetical protein OEY87_09215 [Gammaproteobacteria bacterium]|nr:hypothetical protein [Gammaproteobacteria bacterium]